VKRISRNLLRRLESKTPIAQLHLIAQAGWNTNAEAGGEAAGQAVIGAGLMSSAPAAAVEGVEAALPFADNHDLGMANSRSRSNSGSDGILGKDKVRRQMIRSAKLGRLGVEEPTL
jgi:hypothetical protein